MMGVKKSLQEIKDITSMEVLSFGNDTDRDTDVTLKVVEIKKSQ